MEFEWPIVELAGDLVENYVLLVHDAVQVASAISVHRNLVTARLQGLIFLWWMTESLGSSGRGDVTLSYNPTGTS